MIERERVAREAINSSYIMNREGRGRQISPRFIIYNEYKERQRRGNGRLEAGP